MLPKGLRQMLIVDAMTTEDWPEVARIYQEGMDTNLATFQTTCPPYEQWDAGHLTHSRLILRDSSTTVGWAALASVSNRCVYAGVSEVSVYIDTQHQGRGLGERLLKALIRLSVDNGIWTLQSQIMRDNAASIRLHDKCGFRMVGYRERIGRDRNNIWRDTVLMERREPSIN